MAGMGIILVVPESLKAKDSIAAKAAEYRGHKNVLSFHEFFHKVLGERRMPSWSLA